MGAFLQQVCAAEVQYQAVCRGLLTFHVWKKKRRIFNGRPGKSAFSLNFGKEKTLDQGNYKKTEK